MELVRQFTPSDEMPMRFFRPSGRRRYSPTPTKIPLPAATSSKRRRPTEAPADETPFVVRLMKVPAEMANRPSPKATSELLAKPGAGVHSMPFVEMKEEAPTAM